MKSAAMGMAVGALCALLTLGLSPGLQADGVSGVKVSANTREVLHEVTWSRDLADAKARAGKEKKLVFWMQVVGELDGGL